VDLQALGNIGEFVGAIGMIASLIYLAGQVHHAQQVAAAESLREIQSGYGRLALSIIEDADVARIWHDGGQNRDALPSVERMRYDYLLAQHVSFFVECHAAYQDGLMEKALYEGWRKWVAMVLESPGGREWWSDGRHLFQDNVVEALEELRASVPSAVDLLKEPARR